MQRVSGAEGRERQIAARRDALGQRKVHANAGARSGCRGTRGVTVIPIGTGIGRNSGATRVRC